MKLHALLALILLAGSSTGCATVLRPFLPARQLGVYSKPEGADVFLDGTAVGRTPCTIQVPHTADGLVLVKLEGYEPYEVVLEKRTYWAVFLDLLPIILYPVILIIYHDSDEGVSWRDDFGPAAAISFGSAAGAAFIDLATRSSQAFPKRMPSIEVQLIKRDP